MPARANAAIVDRGQPWDGMPTIIILDAAHRVAARYPARRRRWLAAAALVLALVLAVAPVAARPARAADVLIFAAASTANAITEICRLAEREGLSRIAPAFASSSALAKQIDNGAPADIFISANVRWMDFLERKNAIDRGSRRDLLRNALVLIAPKGGGLAKLPAVVAIGRGFPLAARLAGGRLAIGDPAHVPAGIYGKQALVSLGLWPSVAGRLAPTANVRAALTLVERGEVEAGIVYATDAAIVAGKVTVIGAFPAGSHEPIIYPAAIVAGRDREAVRQVFAFLASAKAAAVFARHGFAPIAAKP